MQKPEKTSVIRWLLPLARIYGAGVSLRNWLYDRGILKTARFDVPVICIGNLTVGGTGKTPHTEYLIRLLSGKHRVAVLSRGYKRRSKGFVLADGDTRAEEIGDEPFQMKRKFPHISVAVDADRCHGVRQLEATVTPPPEVVLLDDAYQHRRITPGLNILLVNYHRPIHTDDMLPAGRLREPAHNKSRAHIVIVTKCPANMKPLEYKLLRSSLGLFPYQTLFFSTFRYGDLYSLYGNRVRPLASLGTDDEILLLTGIASPDELIRLLQQYTRYITSLAFADHHRYTAKDVAHINRQYADMPPTALVITTEKDAARLLETEGVDERVRNNLYVLPIEVEFLQGDANKFNDKVLSYVSKNSRDSRMA